MNFFLIGYLWIFLSEYSFLYSVYIHSTLSHSLAYPCLSESVKSVVRVLLYYSFYGDSWFLFIAPLLGKCVGRPSTFYVLLLLDLSPDITYKMAKFVSEAVAIGGKNGVANAIKVDRMLWFNFATVQPCLFFLFSLPLFLLWLLHQCTQCTLKTQYTEKM